MCDVLDLFKVTVVALSGEKADLSLSEKLIVFTMKKLREQDLEINKDLKVRFMIRIDEVRMMN